MDEKWEHHDICWLKDLLVVVGVVMIIGAVLMALVIGPVVKSAEQRSGLETYYYQAAQAATPKDFAVNLRLLNEALLAAGMDEGITNLFINGPDDNMAFKRLRFLSFAQRAEALEALPISATEVSTGLADLRVALKNINLGVYGFWLWNQGGAWLQFYIPVMLGVLAIVFFIVSDALPYQISRRVKVKGATA